MKNLLILAGSVVVFAFCSCKKAGSYSEKVELQNSLDSLSYCIGVSIGANMNEQSLDSLDFDLIAAGMYSSLKGDSNASQIDAQSASMYIRRVMQAAAMREQEVEKKAGEDFLAENLKKEGMKSTPSGLQYRVIREGKGPKPDDNDSVMVHYTGHLIDGKVFDSSVERGQPAQFAVNRVIAGWSEGLKMMKEGAKWELYVPTDLAYGMRPPTPEIPVNSVLIFDVELLKVMPVE